VGDFDPSAYELLKTVDDLPPARDGPQGARPVAVALRTFLLDRSARPAATSP